MTRESGRLTTTGVEKNKTWKTEPLSPEGESHTAKFDKDKLLYIENNVNSNTSQNLKEDYPIYLIEGDSYTSKLANRAHTNKMHGEHSRILGRILLTMV